MKTKKFSKRWLQQSQLTTKYQPMKNCLMLFVWVFCANMAFSQVSATERQALLDFYNATNGPNWTSENDSDPTNDWDFSGVVTSDWEGLIITDGHVTNLMLSGNNLLGFLPESLGDLVNLEQLNLARNNIYGTIPISIQLLTRLTLLDLGSNELQGFIPDVLFSLTQLIYFDLAANQLEGAIPDSFQSLPNLQFLFLNGNELSGTIPQSIWSLSKLRWLWLRGNQLEGTLSNDMGSLTSLEDIAIGHNKLSGSIPDSFDSLESLNSFEIIENNFSGTIPNSFWLCESLEAIYLWENQLEGSIPEEIANLNRLRIFYISDNKFSGAIPTEMASITTLSNVGLENNNFSGTIPDLTVNSLFRISGNNFHFGDFESNFNQYSGLPIFQYLPQKQANETTNIQVGVDAALTLTTTVSGSQNHYQWFKDGVAIPGAPDSPNLVIPRAKSTDTGVYYCRVSSDIVTDLIIERNPIYVNVSGEGPPRFVTGRNSIYTRNYQEERSSVPSSKFLSDDGYIQDITYFDGLGRPEQQIGIRQAPDKKDIVSFTEYDDYGREQKQWLPIHEPTEPLGSFRVQDMVQATKTYYKSAYPDDFEGILTEDINPYAEQGFEASPLNRVEKQAAPGETWKMGNGHEVEMAYLSNVANEVRRFNVTLSYSQKTHNPSLGVQGFYPAGELSKTIVRDENHSGTSQAHTVEEFKDKQGRVLLKRTYGEVGSSSTITAHDTYYVYDDYGNLSYVLPPLMEPQTASLTNLLANMEDLGYQYVYDHRNRVVQKWVPGKKGWDHMVYNNLDQPVLTQDPNLRADNEWLFTKYDAFGRVTYTGIMVDTQDRIAVQEDVSGVTGTLWVSRKGTAINLGGAVLYYSNAAYPTTGISEVHTISYYDNYDNLDLPSGAPGSSVVLRAAAETTASNVQGLPTFSKVRVLDVAGSNNWISSLSYYDDKGRAVYGYSQNDYLGTVDIVETQLDFVGKPLKVRTTHTKAGTTIVTIDNFTYDHVGRLLAQTQCIGDATLGNSCPPLTGTTLPRDLDLTGQTVNNVQKATNSIFMNDGSIVPGGELLLSADTGASGGEELIALNEYDKLGLLKRKRVGGKAAGSVGSSIGLQEITHSYNVRGWLTQINDPSNLGNQLFAFGLKYADIDDPTKRLYNGNISQTFWKTASVVTGSNAISERYTYSYDALNRIVKAEDDTGHYNLDLVEYDKHGNIEKLQRQGHLKDNPVVAADFGMMDNLTYAYTGNQLQSVVDQGAVTGFLDGQPSGVDYLYDDNGNMLSDANKGITAIEYNHLDLPTKVTINGNGNTGNIVYIYDATGGKLKKIATDTGESSVTTTEYASGYIYEGNATATTLQFFAQPEGYVKVNNGEYDYVYQYTDHLGNVRLSYTLNPNDGGLEVVEENNYYPFGLKHKGYNSMVSELGNDAAQRWKFGGKEYMEDMDLNWYDVTARNYDPALGRWMNLDPLAEAMRRHSPYNYAFDNPIFFLDADGMMPKGSQGGQSDSETQYRVEDENGNVVVMNSAELEKYIKANGTTDDFKFSGFGNGKGGPSNSKGSSNGDCKTGDCYEAYFGAQAEMMRAELNAMNPVRAVKDGLLNGAKNFVGDAWDGIKTQFEKAVDDPIGEWERGFSASGGIAGITGPGKVFQIFKSSYDFGFDTATTLLDGNPYGAGYMAGNYFAGAAVSGAVGYRLSSFSVYSIKPLRAKGGKINGFTISRGSGYGAKPRFDVHPLGRASKKSNSLNVPQWWIDKKLPIPHYHRGKGNNLNRHRPWEKGWNDKHFFKRF